MAWHTLIGDYNCRGAGCASKIVVRPENRRAPTCIGISLSYHAFKLGMGSEQDGVASKMG